MFTPELITTPIDKVASVPYSGMWKRKQKQRLYLIKDFKKISFYLRFSYKEGSGVVKNDKWTQTVWTCTLERHTEKLRSIIFDHGELSAPLKLTLKIDKGLESDNMPKFSPMEFSKEYKKKENYILREMMKLIFSL